MMIKTGCIFYSGAELNCLLVIIEEDEKRMSYMGDERADDDSEWRSMYREDLKFETNEQEFSFYSRM